MVLAICALSAWGQSDDMFYKIEAGATFGKFSAKLNPLSSSIPGEVKSTMGVGWMARAMAQVYMTNTVGVEAGLGLQQLNSSNSLGAIDVDPDKWKVLSLELPVRATFRMDVGMVTINPSVGLFFSYGLKATDKDLGLSLYSAPINVLKHFNVGIDAGLDFILTDLIKLGLGYQHGWVNMSKYQSYKLKANVLSVSLGVLF